MSEMMKRAARALCARSGEDPDKVVYQHITQEEAKEGQRLIPVGVAWENHVWKVRVVIAAMRRPTDAMVQAARPNSRDIGEDEIVDMFGDMIDAALGD